MKIILKSPSPPMPNNYSSGRIVFFTRILFFACIVSSCSPNQSTNAENAKHRSTQSVHALPPSGCNATSKSVSKSAPVDSLIMPGVSIGIIKLEADADSVFKKFGKPDAGDGAMGKAVATWYESHDPASNALSIFTARDVGNSPIALIKQIRVTSSGFKTKQGVGPSSSLREIQAAFNLETNKGYKMDDMNIAVYSHLSGISFEIDESGHCIGVVVYPEGNFHPDTYFRFLPGITSNQIH